MAGILACCGFRFDIGFVAVAMMPSIPHGLRMKLITYLTVRAKGTEELDENVNASLGKGFELYGTPYATSDGWLCQALVRDDQDSKKFGF